MSQIVVCINDERPCAKPIVANKLIAPIVAIANCDYKKHNETFRLLVNMKAIWTNHYLAEIEKVSYI